MSQYLRSSGTKKMHEQKTGPNKLSFSASLEAKKRNNPQPSSMVVELLLLLGSSMTAALILYNPRDSEPVLGATFFLFFGVGAFEYQQLRSLLPRKAYKQTQVTLFYVGGVLLLAGSEIYGAVLIARAAVGLGTGLVYVEYLTKVAEVSVPRFRGMFASCGGLIYYGCLVLGSAFLSFESEASSLHRWNGAFVLLFALLAQIFVFLYSIESPVYFLSRGEVFNAERAMMRLRSEPELTTDIREDIMDFQDMLVEDATKTSSIVTQGNLRPLVLVLAARLVSVATLNFPFVFLRTSIADQVFAVPENSGLFGALVLTGARFVSALVLLYLVDLLGRRKLYLTSVVGSSVIALTLGCLVFFEVNVTLLAVVCVAFEVLAALGFCGISDIYTSEAFCTTKKTSSVGFVLALEQLTQGLLFLLFNVARHPGTDFADYWYIPVGCGVFILVVGVWSWVKVPETKHLTYRQTRSAFL